MTDLKQKLACEEAGITVYLPKPMTSGINAKGRFGKNPDKMRLRRQTVEHPFGTIKSWMGSTHFQMKTLKHVSTEMALHVLAYNMKRVMRILGVGGLMEAIRT
jgi:hypothetical protein